MMSRRQMAESSGRRHRSLQLNSKRGSIEEVKKMSLEVHPLGAPWLGKGPSYLRFVTAEDGTT